MERLKLAMLAQSGRLTHKPNQGVLGSHKITL